MPPTSPRDGSVRSAAELNEEIRALWARAGGTLSAEERQAYAALIVAWADAIRAEVVEAA